MRCMARLLTLFLVATPMELLAQEWRSINPGKLLGVSGIALIDRDTDRRTFLIVHDTKGRKVYTARVTVKGMDLRYEALDWVGLKKEPKDLEALTRVPGDKSFMALASEGIVYRVRIDRDPKGTWDAIHLLNSFKLPKSDYENDFEGFSLQTFGDDVLAVWAYRGNNAEPAKVYWGLLRPSARKIDLQGSTPLKAPWPVACRVPAGAECSIRHVSDLKVDANGLLYISSAADPGDDGPFDSALYIAGVFRRTGSQFELQLRSPITELSRFMDRKVEAIEILGSDPPTFAFGSDDENNGGSIYVD